jgi:GntR family transcriptional regulator
LGITIDRDAEIPIGVQLAWALRTRIGDGRLEANARLPGLRELAASTGANVNTIRVVYQRLEHEGLIDSRQGNGTFVASTPRRRTAATTIAADAAREAIQTGVDPREVAAALYVAPSTPRSSASDAVERRRALRDQIATLERTLGELVVSHPGLAPSHADAAEELGPRLLDVEALERVRADLVRRLSLVQAAIDGLGVVASVEDEPPKPAPKRRRAAKPQPRARMRPATEGA